MTSPIRSTERVRIWLILTQEHFGRLLDSSSKDSGPEGSTTGFSETARA